MGSRLKSVDFLRGSAALAVVLHHAILYSDAPPTGALWFRALHTLLGYGYLGVPLFFVISGFCIHQQWTRKYAEAGRQDLSFVGFWKRRLHRLYPPYAVVLCLSMSLVVVAYFVGKSVALVDSYPEPRPRWMLIDFVAHLGMLHGFHPILDKAGGNPPFWTLAREEYFYVMYFGLLMSRRYWGLVASFAGVVVAGLAFPLMMRAVISEGSSWWSIVTSSAIVLWVQWCFGMVAVEAHYGLLKLPRWCASGWLVPLWAASALVIDRYFVLFSPLLWGLTFFTLLNFCLKVERSNRWPKLTVIRWLSGVGLFSYSLYLVHNPVRAVVKQLLGSWAATSNPFAYCFFALLMAIAGYYSGKAFFSLVERRFLNTNRKVDNGDNERGRNHSLETIQSLSAGVNLLP
jgi:peptidoglycan/LPS O-acetylase OafA/YrhL